jgi:hypothetical protein
LLFMQLDRLRRILLSFPRDKLRQLPCNHNLIVTH